MKNIKKQSFSLFKIKTIFIVLIFLNTKSIAGIFEEQELDIYNNVIAEFDKLNNLIADGLNNFQNPPLALKEDPWEINEFIEPGDEIIMSPLAGLALLLSHKFNKVTLVSSEIYELGMHMNIYREHPFENNNNYLSSIAYEQDVLEEDLLKNYLTAFYNNIPIKRLETEIYSHVCDIFAQKNLYNKTIFLSYLLEQDKENQQKNLEIIKAWVTKNNNIVIIIIKCQNLFNIIKNMENIFINEFKSKKFSNTVYLFLKNN